jgi:hypothetical protein
MAYAGETYHRVAPASVEISKAIINHLYRFIEGKEEKVGVARGRSLR